MKFDDLDKKLRIYETANDFNVPLGFYIVARIDGRGFTKLTKKIHDFEKPFDPKFRDMMVETTKHLMNCGFKINYAYTQSDEISLLFDLNEGLFGRKTRKWNSILAGEASAKFSLLLGDFAAFDCRLSILPNKEEVIDYFRWRHQDSQRNSIKAHCYWFLRKKGFSAREASGKILGTSTSFKNEFLFENGINYNNLPNWQKRGIGFYIEKVKKEGFNPLKKEKTFAERNEIIMNSELPIKDEYTNLLREIIL
ncbi:tRNA(His) guanylyltransferase Thg1 family protein [Aureivirga marina]|uniref:tRNA(His) guanylyltransferase Thg1 family protein n=1 Tax=Aureivirga marina TaxID=1182451 RepID=UPI0018C91AB6|nr:tRNA(His) guanylyltransferase Thg1 family protein [Aureivirga marina]